MSSCLSFRGDLNLIFKGKFPAASCGEVRFITQGFMNPIRVVEEKVFVQASKGFRDSHILIKVNLFIFDRSPESLHEDIVINPTADIHADAFSFKDSREIVAGKLRALIGVENLRFGNLKNYPFLVDAVQRYFRVQEPNTDWITQH